MYSLVTAVLLERNKPKGFEEVNVGGMSIKTLFANYSVGYLVLTNKDLPGEQFLGLDVMRGLNLGLATYDTTVNQWLTLNGKKLLPHSLKEPLFNFSRVNYADAYQAGFKRLAVHPRSTIGGYPLSALTDLYLYKDMVDGDILNKNTIFTVNGYLHTHTRHRQGVKVSDATRSILHSGCDHVGVLSFQQVGGVKLVNFGLDMIHSTKDDIKLYEECYLNLGQSLENKTVLLSIAGQLIYSNDVYRVFDAETGKIALSLAKINFIDRIQEAVKFMEFPDLMLGDRDYRVSPIDIEYILSNPFILSVLRMSQTFAIIIDHEFMGVIKEPVNYGSVYGRYYSPEFGYKPMIDEFGRFVPYFYQGVHKHPFMKNKYIFSTPFEYTERKFNIRDTGKWRYRPITASESTTFVTRPMECRWLTLQFASPA